VRWGRQQREDIRGAGTVSGLRSDEGCLRTGGVLPDLGDMHGVRIGCVLADQIDLTAREAVESLRDPS
jgi:hypothetical protein